MNSSGEHSSVGQADSLPTLLASYQPNLTYFLGPPRWSGPLAGHVGIRADIFWMFAGSHLQMSPGMATWPARGPLHRANSKLSGIGLSGCPTGQPRYRAR